MRIGLIALAAAVWLGSFVVVSFSQSCSDITGTGGGGSTSCPNPRPNVPSINETGRKASGGVPSAGVGAAAGAAAAILGTLDDGDQGRTTFQRPPPASCSRKFVGTWKYRGGSTTVHADGTMKPHCAAFCVSVQYWTCDGDRFSFTNPDGGTIWHQILLPGGTQMKGPSGIATKEGFEAAPSKNGKQHKSVATKDRGKAQALMGSGARVEQAARASGLTRASIERLLSRAEDAYSDAATLFAKAGDKSGEKKALVSLARVKASYAKIKTINKNRVASENSKVVVSKNCKAARAYLKTFKGDVASHRAILKAMRKNGCKPD